MELLSGQWLDSSLDSKLRLGRFWNPLGSVLGALGRLGPLRALLNGMGALAVVLEASWALSERSWRLLGRSSRLLRRPWACLGCAWGGLGGVLDAFWEFWGPS